MILLVRSLLWKNLGLLQKSELAGQTMAGLVILTKNMLFSRDFAEKPSAPA